MPPKRKPTTQDALVYTHWLVKAEPDSRIEKGVDVKFSIDDLEELKVSSWEGVRNHQAKNFLKSQMKLNQLCLFYASNTKVPGVSGIAKVVKEGYPDHNAWDSKHPYYDPKSKESDPTWFMVDVEFVAKLPHLVPLSLLQLLATYAPSSPSSPSSSSNNPSASSTAPSVPALPPSLSYLSPSDLSSIASSTLLSRGRLSVQPATEGFFRAVRGLGEKGGWEEGGWFGERLREKKGEGKAGGKEAKGKWKGKGKGKKEEDVEDEAVDEKDEVKDEGEDDEAGEGPQGKRGRKPAVAKKGKGKREQGKVKAEEEEEADEEGNDADEAGAEASTSGSGSRRSKRLKVE